MLSIGDQATEEGESCDFHDNKESCDSKDIDPDESELDSETELMRSMGLPLQFGGMSTHKNFEVSIHLLLFINFLCKNHVGFFFIPNLMHLFIRALQLFFKVHIYKLTRTVSCVVSLM